MYLRDTAVIQHQHVDALRLASQAVMDLLSALPEDAIALSRTMADVSIDPHCKNMQTRKTSIVSLFQYTNNGNIPLF